MALLPLLAMPAERTRARPRLAVTFVLMALLGAHGANGLARTGTNKKGSVEALVRPLRPHTGTSVTIRVVDRVRELRRPARVCLEPPSGGESKCRDVQLRRGRAHPSPRFRVDAPGRWKLVVKVEAGPLVRRVVRVRGTGQRLELLATGDSMIQYVDTSLTKRFEPGGDIDVRTDARISTGISKPFLLNWVAHARRQAAGIRPDVTVVFIGANDGFPLRVSGHRKAPCCGRAWVRAYARRAHSMMASYARRGQGQVCWLNLPAPRGGSWRHIYAAVNRALRRAARSFGPEVRLIDIARVFTPRFKFRSAMRWKGRRVVVRQPDGVHLSVAGASIAAELVGRALRAERAL
jgi:lysophospholipase L1-like esterase